MNAIPTPSRTMLACVLLMAAVAGSAARAELIPVANYSFENPAVAVRTTVIDIWTDALNRAAVENYVGGTGFPTAPDGNQWLSLDRRSDAGTPAAFSYTSGAYAVQKIGTIDETLTYTMNVTVGSRSNVVLPGDFIGGFFTGTTADFGTTGELAVFDAGNPVFSGFTGGTTAQTVAATVSWNAVGSGLQGDDLYVGFYIPLSAQSASVGMVLFDNVIVNTAIPEPSSLSLLLGAGVAVFLMQRRRRRA